MVLDLDRFKRVEKDFEFLFHMLSTTQSKIQEKLEQHSDGKILKGNELVGWLDEIYTKLIFNGYLVDDSHERDVETDDGLRVSVKTRKGTYSSWTRSSVIPKIESEDCPTHLTVFDLLPIT